MKTKPNYSVVEKVYRYVNDEKEERVCSDITEEACQKTPQNFFLILLSSMLSQLGDALSNPKTVLAWIMYYVNAPVTLISFIVPIREAGSMLPQIIIAGYIRKKAIRKWVWVLGSVLQFVAISSIGLIALAFTGIKAGLLIIALLIIYSLSRGLCSVASKDVLGKTIPKTRRGRLKGYSTSVSGVLVLAAGLFLIYSARDNLDINFYSNLLIFAGLLWLIAAILYANIKEFPGETETGKESIKDALARLKILQTDKQFRNFVISRALLLCSALTAPFYVLLAQNNVGSEGYLLGIFIIVNGLAAIISAPAWGKMADKSSKRVMVIGGTVASLLGILVFTVFILIPGIKGIIWFYPVVVFILAVAHSAVRIGRKTYILDMAGGNKRTDYVAVSNTIIGFILLITGGISALASLISVEGIILVLSILGIAGAYSSSKLPNVEKG